MRVEFNTTEYQFSHGKQPRGRGSWAFFFGPPSDPENFNNVFWTPGNTTYSEAKRMAREEARQRGVSTVYVGS
jgi:hypothetical protein